MEATLEDLVAVVLEEARRLTPDTQYGEVVTSGSYVIEGQFGEVAEKQSSGSYTIEAVITYE